MTRPVGSAFLETRSPEKKRANEGEESAEHFAMSGVCCAHDDDDDNGEQDTGGVGTARIQGSGSRSLRSLVVSKIVAQNQQLQRLWSLGNSTGQLSEVEAVQCHTHTHTPAARRLFFSYHRTRTHTRMSGRRNGSGGPC